MSGLAYSLPYYATGLRADQLAEALDELTHELLRHGALEVRVYRSKEDPYRFLQVIHVQSKTDWEKLWNSEVFIRFRTVRGPWFQKPMAYAAQETISHGVAAGVHDVFATDPYDVPVTGEASASEPVAAGSPGL